MNTEFLIVESDDREDFLDDLLYGPHGEDILFECGPDCEPFVMIHEYLSPEGPGQLSRAMNWDECVDYMLSECMVSKRDGFYYTEDNTLEYSRDSYTGEGDVDLEGGPIRPARWHEMREVLTVWQCLLWFPTQLKLHWLYAQGVEM